MRGFVWYVKELFGVLVVLVAWIALMLIALITPGTLSYALYWLLGIV